MVYTRPIPVQLPQWMEISSNAVQGLLYLLLFSVPLTAIAGAWFKGHPLTLLAGVQIPLPVGISHDVGATIATIHTWLGDARLWLAVFHGPATLYPHFVLKDGIFVSMLPRWVACRQANSDHEGFAASS